MFGNRSTSNNKSVDPSVHQPQQQQQQHHHDNETVFGDAYSVKSRGSTLTQRFHDEPEADYDQGATALYRAIENKDWDAAMARLDTAPDEARTWVSRREPGTDKTRWRLLPLHAVCIFRAPLALIEALLEMYEEGPQMKDDQGMLPVHLACRNGASKGVVLTLLKAFPESLFVMDRKRRSLQDLISSSSSANKEGVLDAMKKFEKELVYAANKNNNNNNNKNNGATTTAPSGGASLQSENNSATKSNSTVHQATQINEVDYENRTMLFRYILKKDWKAVARRAAAFPEEAATWIVTKGFNGNLRFLPLHKACVLQPPEHAVHALLDAYPDAANSHDQDGWSPAHCACFYGASESIVNALMHTYPAGAHAKDDEGRLPLHYACLKGAALGVVEVLLATYAKGALVKDSEGRLPVHHACSKGAPEAVVDALLKAGPKGAQVKDDQGRLALHHACRKNSSERVIRTLLRVYPRAAQIKDDQDKLAIHYACQHGANAAVITFLLATYPESINCENGFGITPLDEVKGLDDPKMEPVLKVLTKFKREIDKSKGGDRNQAMDERVATLENQIAGMEKTLGKVALLGKDLKSSLRKKRDAVEVLDQFADDLIFLGGIAGDGNGSGGAGSSPGRKTKSTSTPLKGLQPTPTKSGLFGRKNKTSK